ncbi:VWA domain-containing protein [Candidatus Woesearchaeota archaeon]|nr:VWA domain-containing protein [Candidatus Woesearchaeota archaeon]
MIPAGQICLKGYCLANPSYIYLIFPLALLLASLTWITFVRFKKPEEKKAFVKEHRLIRIIFFALRSLVIMSLLIAIASPYKTKETMTEGSPSLTILADNSSSFGIFDTSVALKLKEELEQHFPATLKYIASGERSAIGDGILRNAEGDDHLLVISDGYNNYGRDLGDIVLLSSVLNTTIHTLKLEPVRKDVSVFISGPSQVIEQSETSFNLHISNIGGVDYSKVEVFIDGSQVKVGSSGEFQWRFSRGYHKIEARILFPKDDHFEQNNIYYKTVKALPRPRLLFVADDEGPLQKALENVYDVSAKKDIPSELGDYDAVVLNDIPSSRISDGDVDALSDYLAEKGNGLVVVGGENSFDNGGYENSYFESILPVKVGVGERKRDEAYNIVFVIDLSGTVNFPFRSDSEETVLDFEKAFLLDIINSLNMEDKISIAGFVSRSHCVPKSLHCILTPISHIPSLHSVIRSLSTPSDDTGTNIAIGLSRARQVLEAAKGSKNVVLITDGIDPNENGIMQSIQVMNSYGIKLYTIGVGQFVNSALLKRMADTGGGLYFEPDESGRLKIIFMGDEEEQRCAKAGSGRLLLMDTSHWITKGDLEISATIGGYNLVVPKLWGRKLAATDCDRTILASGRYGLGRVAVLSTDDGSKWSGSLLNKQNSKLITRMMNWAIGDFTKDSELDVRIKDTSLGRPTDVNVISEEKPEHKGLEFSKVDAGLYSAKFYPKKEGFYNILGATTAVSYNDEYLKIGLNPKLEELAVMSGGKVFSPEDIEPIRDTIISMSKRVRIETIDYRWPLAILAVILFLADILIRRIRENMNIGGF